MKDALGHGSNAHNAGIASLGKKLAVSSKVIKVVKKNPYGFSVKPQTGVQPKDGYMVSLPGHSLILDPSHVTPDTVSRYAQTYADKFADPKAHIGGWTDGNTGLTHLDVSHNIMSRSAAVKAGRANNQIKIWDVKRKREIDTGGTGDVH
jgi:hypothetical protein